MAGLDWDALPVIVEMLGVHDVETLVHQLTALRDHLTQKASRGFNG